MKIDYIIIGQGLAGSLLAWELIRRDKRVVVIDQNHWGGSTRVAAGLVNPVTGKRLALTEGFETYYPVMIETYEALAAYFGETFFYAKPILRVLRNVQELKKYQGKKDVPYLRDYALSEHIRRFIKQSEGCVEIIKGGYCDTVRLMDCLRSFFRERSALREVSFDYGDLVLTEDGVRYKDIEARKVIFCEGYAAVNNLWFQDLVWTPAKGEVLTVRVNNLDEDRIWNAGKWLLPTGNGVFRAGATYEWDDLSCAPTQKGRDEILRGLKGFFRVDMDVIDHKAGVRPVLKDQRPIIELHRDHPQIGIFNGLGSKGVLYAPYFARQLTGRLLSD